MDKVLSFSMNAGFSVCSIAICLCIIFSYLLKTREKKLEVKNRLFISYLLSIILMSIIEIIYVIYFLNVGVNGVYAKSFYFLYSMAILLATTSSWMFTISYRSSLNNSTSDKKSNTKKYFFYTLIAIIELTLGIMIFVMPVQIYPHHGIYTFNSLPITLTVFYTLISIAIFVAVLYFRNPNLTKRDLYPIIASLVVVSGLLVYRLITNTDINVETFQLTIYGLGIFFTLENQDYKLLETTKQKQADAEEATKSQKEFLADMSHEIRSPMNTILGLSQLLLEEDSISKDSIKDDMTNIHDVSTSLLSLINNISDYSSVISGKDKLIEQEYDLKEVLLDLNLDVMSKIKNENIHFDYSINDSIPKKLYGDYSKITKILYNIIYNEISHASSGQIYLKANGNRVENDDVFHLEFLVSTNGVKSNVESDSTKVESGESVSSLTSENLNNLIINALTQSLNGQLEIKQEPGFGNEYILSVDQKFIDDKSNASTNKQENVEERSTESKEEREISLEEGGVSHV